MIYLVITPFFPESGSFRGPFIFDQVRAIERTGCYKVVVFKPKPWYSKEKDYEYEGVKVFRFSTYELPSAILPGLFDFLSVWSLKRKLKSLRININDIEVVHAHVTGLGVFANALKRKNKSIKTVLQHHGFDVLSLTNGQFSKYRWHRKWVARYGIGICNRIDLHVGVSDKTLKYLCAFSNIRIKDCFILYNGVDETLFYPIKGLKDASFFTIGCIGNFWELKDQITLIKAARKLIKEGMNHVRVIFIGSGEMLESCRNYVEEKNLSDYFFFKSEVSHKELNHFYNTLDLFVLPSHYEAFGCVYTEAYACGVPFIGVEGQGIAELIPEQDKSKWLIRKGDDESLAELIKYCHKFSVKQYLTIDPNINKLIGNFLKKINENIC